MGGAASPAVRLPPLVRRSIDRPEWFEQEAAERSLWEFTRQMWRWIDPAPFRDNWHIGAIAEHLEAVTRGEIHRLLINIPPRHSKSSIVAVIRPGRKNPFSLFARESIQPATVGVGRPALLRLGRRRPYCESRASSWSDDTLDDSFYPLTWLELTGWWY